MTECGKSTTLASPTGLTLSAEAARREHSDPYADASCPIETDRQRVVYSSAFRRLQYKTQVFLARGDHFRSRLTHTLEVATLARRLARHLGVNDGVAEVVALAHDLGHPPFGHAGERAIDACVRRHSDDQLGFEHNAHSLRVVVELEHPYPDFRGLNLTSIVRLCLRTHETVFDHPETAGDEVAPDEGRVVALADQLTYVFHDLQDAVYAGLLSRSTLGASALWRECESNSGASRDALLRTLRPTVERMQQVVIAEIGASDERCDDGRATLSGRGKKLLSELTDVLRSNVYRHRSVIRMDSKARRIIGDVFDAYVSEPQLMPARFVARVESQGVVGVVADYVAGMTDRFCQEEHARLFDPRVEP